MGVAVGRPGFAFVAVTMLKLEQWIFILAGFIAGRSVDSNLTVSVNRLRVIAVQVNGSVRNVPEVEDVVAGQVKNARLRRAHRFVGGVARVQHFEAVDINAVAVESGLN